MHKILFTKRISNRELVELKQNNEVFTEDFIRIEYLYPQEIPFCDNFIITSKNGLESIINLFSVDFLKEKKYYVVGKKTADKLSYFTDNIEVVTDNANELSERITSLKSQKYTYFCSDIRLPILNENLINKGIQLQEIISYKTLLNPKKIDYNFDSIVFLSPSAVESFAKLNEIPKETRIFAIGKTTASRINSFYNVDVHIPKESNLESLLDLIKYELNVEKR